MKLKILKYSVLALALGSFQYYFLGKWYLNDAVITNLIVFLSIIFGFYITSFSIFSTSDFVKSLYKRVNSKNKKETLLHSLLNEYKNGLLLILFTIVYLLTIEVILAQFENNRLHFKEWFLLILLPLVSLDIWYSFKLIKHLINVVIQEAKT